MSETEVGGSGLPADRNALVYRGAMIRDDGEMLNLTDMWRASGSDDGKRPSRWRELPATIEFSDYIKSTIGKSDSDLFRVRSGGTDPGTWAHWQVGLAYAKYLSPEFHKWCNDVVRAYMERRLEPRLPRNYIEALEALVVSEKEKERLRHQVEVKDLALRSAEAVIEDQAVSVEALDRIAGTTDLYGMRETAYILQMPQNQFSRDLVTRGWCHRRNASGALQGYADKIKRGYLAHKLRVYKRSDGSQGTRKDVMFTTKGITVLAEVFGVTPDFGRRTVGDDQPEMAV